VLFTGATSATDRFRSGHPKRVTPMITRWTQVENIFQQALARDVGSRARPEPINAGRLFGRYQVLSPIGAGGMGSVYRARDTRLHREVALKVLPAEFRDDPERRRRFEREARSMASLSHPNVIAVYDVGTENDTSFIVTELVNALPLRGCKLGFQKTMDAAVQITRGLTAAHEARIIHRDLKPDNILRTRDGHIKILDFGLAKVSGTFCLTESAECEGSITHPGVLMGTVGYMSPEQLRGLAVDHRSDIFSFGVTLHEMFSGQQVFSGNTAAEVITAILRDEPPGLPEFVPPAVRQIVTDCLEKDPANRFQSARDLSLALAALSLLCKDSS
jgi:serine/threonine protein kinase